MSHKQKAKDHKHARPKQHAGEYWQKKGWTETAAHAAPPALPRRDFPEEIASLVEAAGEGGESIPALTEELMFGLMANAALADEPEFEDLFFQPLEAVEMWGKVAEEKGLTPQAFVALPEAERADKQVEIMTECTRRLVTDEVFQDILKRLDILRQRLKRSGKKTEAARVSILHWFASMGDNRAFLSSTSLIIAILSRSMEAGYDLLESTTNSEAGVLLNDKANLTTRLEASSFKQSSEMLLNKMPGLRKYLEGQADKIWEEGQQAVFSGDLYLGVYTLDELVEGMKTMASAAGYDLTQDIPPEQRAPGDSHPDATARMVDSLDAYVSQLFTPARLDQLRAKMAAFAKEPAQDEHEKKWQPFVIMMSTYLVDEDAVQHEKAFLTNALIGEINLAARSWKGHK